jgi:hypothetical protein
MILSDSMLNIPPSTAELLKNDESLTTTLALLAPAVIAAPEDRVCKFEKVQFSNSTMAPLYTEISELDSENEESNTLLEKVTLVVWASFTDEVVPIATFALLRLEKEESLIVNGWDNWWPRLRRLPELE